MLFTAFAQVLRHYRVPGTPTFSALDFVFGEFEDIVYIDEVWLRLEELCQITVARPLYSENARQTLTEIRETAQLDIRIQHMALMIRLHAKALKQPPRELIAQIQRLNERSLVLQLTREENAIMHILIAAGGPTRLWDRLARKYDNTPLTLRILNRVINSLYAAEGSNLK